MFNCKLYNISDTVDPEFTIFKGCSMNICLTVNCIIALTPDTISDHYMGRLATHAQ